MEVLTLSQSNVSNYQTVRVGKIYIFFLDVTTVIRYTNLQNKTYMLDCIVGLSQEPRDHFHLKLKVTF